MISTLRRLLIKLIPDKVLKLLRSIRTKWRIYILGTKHKNRISEIRAKEQISVVFFALFDSVWKLDYLYKLLESDFRFKPTVVVCPVVNYGKENMIERMEACYDVFINKGFNVIKSYDSFTDSYLDIISELDPDVIFYTSPYRGLIDNRYYIDKFEDKLTCYVPYFYGETRDSVFVNQPVHNLCWRFFVESDFHRYFCQKNMYNGASNVVVTGYPGVDYFLDSDYQASDNVWKITDKSLKRIIWAPHHTIFESDMITYSCFLKYADFMLEIAQKYEDKIQIAFKPHPVLRNKLDILWGKDKTDSYYNKWDSLKNTSLKEGEYIDLFLTSDAMIHDSGSFLIEYLYVNKPVMRTVSPFADAGINDFALECLNYYYQATTEEEVENFIIDVIEGKDALKESRTDFKNQILCPSDGLLPSENIYRHLCEQLL